MDKCQKVERVITRYLLGTLPPWSRAFVVRHIDICPPCRRLLDSHTNMELLLENLPAETPPSGLWNRVSNEIAQEAPGHQKVPTAPRDWRPAALVAAAGLTAGVLLGQNMGGADAVEPSVFAEADQASPRIATFVQQHSSMDTRDPFADQVSLAAYVTTAYRDNQRMEGEAE